MNAVVRFLSVLRDSPTYGRDRAGVTSSFSVGTAGLLLNGAVLLLLLPLMLEPDDRDVRLLTESLEFGELLALILLGGAAAFATLLVPLRLATVFWGPRVGRYFDQVVLSGISPLQFVIGKAASQNLFLGLVLFLLAPYFVLSLTLGGIDVKFFIAALILIWLYCMALALVTLWTSLFVNELMAALSVTAGAAVLAGLGCIPMRPQPFVMTPFPTLLAPVFSSVPFFGGSVAGDWVPTFLWSAGCMIAVIGVSLVAIHLGPLFGIIRENSTFGEVVRPGDSKRKRQLRLRLHIQRPSELAFFYENRGPLLLREEGLIRWGGAFGALVVLLGTAHLVFGYVMLLAVRRAGSIWANEFHTGVLVIHACALLLGMLAFSHARNSTYLRLRFALGGKAEVASLDTTFFAVYALLSTAAALAVPFCFERLCASPGGTTIFPQSPDARGLAIDYTRVVFEGTAVISIAGTVVYAFQRLACLSTWIKSSALAGVAGTYFFAICLLPVLFGLLFIEVPEFRNARIVADWAPVIVMASPLAVEMSLFRGMGPRFQRDVPTVLFYLLHAALLGLAIYQIRRRGRALRKLYLARPEREVR